METHSVREKSCHHFTDYAALAKQLCSNVQIEFVAKSEIDQQLAFVDAKWEGVMAVPKHTEFTAFKLLLQIRLNN